MVPRVSGFFRHPGAWHCSGVVSFCLLAPTTALHLLSGVSHTNAPHLSSLSTTSFPSSFLSDCMCSCRLSRDAGLLQRGKAGNRDSLAHIPPCCSKAGQARRTVLATLAFKTVTFKELLNDQCLAELGPECTQNGWVDSNTLICYLDSQLKT